MICHDRRDVPLIIDKTIGIMRSLGGEYQMLKRHTFWLWTAVVLQFATAAIHSLSFFIKPAPQNETERQLFELMTTYKQDLGAGFQPTTANMVTALSACLPFLYLLGGLTIAYLMKKLSPTTTLKGIVGIQVLVFGLSFITMLILTFLPPIVMTGLVFVALSIGYFTISRDPS